MSLNHLCNGKYIKQDLFSWPKSQLCTENIWLYLYPTFEVYNQTVVLVKTLSSRSLHDVLSTLIMLWFFFFLFLFFLCLNFSLKIYGIKCTGSVSSFLVNLDVILSFLFLFSLLICILHIREGLLFNTVVIILLWHQRLAQQNLHGSHCC